MPITISIVEDNSQLCESLSALLGKNPDFCCLSFHDCAEDALSKLPEIRPDVVLMDVNLPGVSGVECVRQLKPQLPDTQIIMLTAFQNPENIYQALTAGAVGYLLKQDAPDELLAAIKTVHAGGSPMSGVIARKVALFFHRVPACQSTGCVDELSPCEQHILDMLVQGLYYKEIAKQAGLTYATVHTHIRNIYNKLQYHSRPGVISPRFSFGGSLLKLAAARLF